MVVTPDKIKELRHRTGIGVGKCKDALVESQGDIELAIANLRKAGMALAVKKEGREAKEGKIAFAENDEAIAVAEVKAETDFVINNERFVSFLDDIVNEVLATHPASLDAFLSQPSKKDPSITIDQYRATLVQAIGENIQIERIHWLPKKSDTSLGIYSHMNGKIFTFVEIQGSTTDAALAKDIAMHCAAAAPEFLSPETIPAEVVAHEEEIAQSQMKGKPANIMEKIIQGKINAFYDQVCLVRQKFIKDDSMTIEELVQKCAKEGNKPLKVTRFLRWSVGENES